MRLAHLHLRSPIPYVHSLRLQEAVLEQHYAYNESILKSRRAPTTLSALRPPQPCPTLLTFQTKPVYTVGRRHLKANPLSESQINFLTTDRASATTNKSTDGLQLATFHPSPRGGLLTYHAPGQLTAYLIINLRVHDITPRCFIRLLENAVIETCAKHNVPNATTTTDPGVWIGQNSLNGKQQTQKTDLSCGGVKNQYLEATTRKICAVGVHVTRGITSHGIGLNVFDSPISSSAAPEVYTLPPSTNTEKAIAPGYLSWGFGRIIACGLEGKSVTWLTNEGSSPNLRPDEVAKTLAEAICVGLTQMGRIKMAGIDQVGEDDILANQALLGR